jgi:nitroreductase
LGNSLSKLRQVLASFFTTAQKNTLKQKLKIAKLNVASCFAFTSWSSAIYYFIVSASFRREQHAVLQGRLAYQQSLLTQVSSSVLLRRNIHRLEKGLIMQPRREVFAEDYILETVDEFCQKYSNLDLAELKWAFAVLTEYFNIVGSKPLIDQAKKKFLAVSEVAASRLEPTTFAASVPYTYQNLPATAVSFDSLLQLFKRRRSVRWFLPQPVASSLLEQAINAASLAPSACNRQPYYFVHLDNPETAAEVADFAMGTTGFSGNIPALLVVIGDLSAYPEERDRHVIYIDAALASMQLMLAFDALGLASCPINWPDIESREVKMAQRLNLKPYQRPVMLIAFGYADPQGGIAYSQKKTADNLLRPAPAAGSSSKTQ